MSQIAKEEDIKVAKTLAKIKGKNPLFKFFVASKRGGNANGRGENRSVILATQDGKNWVQYHKVWGENNEARANEIIKLAHKPL